MFYLWPNYSKRRFWTVFAPMKVCTSFLNWNLFRLFLDFNLDPIYLEYAVDCCWSITIFWVPVLKQALFQSKRNCSFVRNFDFLKQGSLVFAYRLSSTFLVWYSFIMFSPRVPAIHIEKPPLANDFASCSFEKHFIHFHLLHNLFRKGLSGIWRNVVIAINDIKLLT